MAEYLSPSGRQVPTTYLKLASGYLSAITNHRQTLKGRGEEQVLRLQLLPSDRFLMDKVGLGASVVLYSYDGQITVETTLVECHDDAASLRVVSPAAREAKILKLLPISTGAARAIYNTLSSYKGSTDLLICVQTKWCSRLLGKMEVGTLVVMYCKGMTLPAVQLEKIREDGAYFRYTPNDDIDQLVVSDGPKDPTTGPISMEPLEVEVVEHSEGDESARSSESEPEHSGGDEPEHSGGDEPDECGSGRELKTA